MPHCNRVLKFPCCSRCLEWSLFCWWDVLDGRLARAALAKVLLAPRERAWGAAQRSGCWRERWLCWLRCASWAGLGGAGMGKLQDCQGVWTVWGCSSEMVSDCFPSRIPTMSRKGAYVLQRVGWCPLYLNQDAFAELHAESILTACYLQPPYLALGVACFGGWHRSSPIYAVWCFPGLRLRLFSNL